MRELVEGENSLIDEVTYEQYRDEKARILSRVSLVPSATSWAFFCIAGSMFGAPRWVFFSGKDDKPLIGLNEITAALRKVVSESVADMVMDDQATRLLDHYLDRLLDSELDLLPKKKRRAIEEMTLVVKAYRAESANEQKQHEVDFYTKP